MRKKQGRAPTAPRLDRLARSIRQAHAAATRAMGDFLEHARRAGDLLFEVKRELPHGQFLAWVDAHCGFGRRTAQLYLQVVKHWDEIVKAQRVAYLPLRRVRQVLAAAGGDEPDPPRIGTDLVREQDRYLTVLRRVEETPPDQLHGTERLALPRFDEVEQAQQRVKNRLAGREAAA
jgi:hypothetical protein